MELRVRALIPLAFTLFAGAVAAQGPCAGKVESIGIDGTGVPWALAVDNHRMVTSDGPTVSSWRLDDPSAPEFLGRWTLWDEASDSSVPLGIDERGFAYVGFQAGDSWYSVRIWDLRDDRGPRPVAQMEERLVDSFVEAGLLVGVSAVGDELVIVDVSDPFEPEVVCTSCGGIDLDRGPPGYGYDHVRIESVAGRAVILDFDEILVVDVGEPSAPVVLASVALPTPVVGTDTKLWANDVLAVAGPTTTGEVVVVDLHVPTAPTLSTYGFGPIWDVLWGAFHRDTLMVYDPLSSPGVLRLDLSDPDDPVELPPVDLEVRPESAVVWNDRLFAGGSSFLQIYDLLGEPSLVAAGPRDRYADRIAVDGGLGLATGGRHLFVYDVDRPGDPVERASLELDWSPQLPATDGELGAVVKYGDGVALFDLRNPESPFLLWTVPVWGAYVTDLEIWDGILAVASRNGLTSGSVELWQVGLSATPTLLSRLERDEPIWQIETSGQRLFLGLEGDVVEVDVSTPDTPVSGAPLGILGSRISGLETVGHELFAVDGFHIAVVDVSEPGAMVGRHVANPGLGAPDGYGGASWLASDGEHLVAGENGGTFNVIGSPESDGTLPFVQLSAPPIWSLASGVWGGELLVASRFNLVTMDLSCAPIEADFTWYTMGTKVQLIDRTTFDSRKTDRQWRWTIDGDPRVFTARSPLIEFDDYGPYEVTVEVTTEAGTASATKTVEVQRPPDVNPQRRHSGRRVRP